MITETFNSKLYNLLFESDDDNESKNDEVCNITQDSLDNDFVQLQCGHKFNYVPIYQELFFKKHYYK